MSSEKLQSITFKNIAGRKSTVAIEKGEHLGDGYEGMVSKAKVTLGNRERVRFERISYERRYSKSIPRI